MAQWLIDREQIDWQKIFNQLSRLGVSRCEAARRINVPYPTLYRWTRGAEPKFTDGLALLTLLKICQKSSQLRMFIYKAERKKL